MTCRNLGGGVIVCGPPPGVYHRMIRHCPICERKRRFVVRWDGAWYGHTVYCACGDRWMDGEMAPRPFKKGWRKEAQSYFRALWDSAAPRDLYDAYTKADCDMAVAHTAEDFTAACEARDAAQRAIDDRSAS